MSPKSAELPGANEEPDFAEVVSVISHTVDLVGGVDRGHCARVGIIASMIAGHLGLSPTERNRVLATGLLHDMGVSSTHIRDPLADDAPRDVDHHSQRGARLASLVPCLSGFAPIIRYHNTPWAELATVETTDDVRFTANIVYLADRLDVWLAPRPEGGSPSSPPDAFTSARRKLGHFFAPPLASAIESLSQEPALSPRLDREGLAEDAQRLIRELPSTRLASGELHALARVLAAIVDGKCRNTAEHSFRVAAIAKHLAMLHGLDPERCAELELAALLHDVGKLGVPDDILNKPTTLDLDESQVMRRHALQSFEVISRLSGLARVANLARWHHERVDGRGYPDGVRGLELPLEARILAAADVFQAMTQTRAYRPGTRKDEVRREIRAIGNDGHLDPDVVSTVDARFDEFWDLACNREGVAGLDPVLADLCLEIYREFEDQRVIRGAN
jgi:HD-GYP domain-containing protein (c-di-GMP phosphodiesterase class II)